MTCFSFQFLRCSPKPFFKKSKNPLSMFIGMYKVIEFHMKHQEVPQFFLCVFTLPVKCSGRTTCSGKLLSICVQVGRKLKRHAWILLWVHIVVVYFELIVMDRVDHEQDCRHWSATIHSTNEFVKSHEIYVLITVTLLWWKLATSVGVN